MEDTASTLAAEHKVSAKTIKNDAAFARAVDHIAAAVGGEEGQGVRQAILARETKVTHDDVKVLAAVATQDAAMARDALAAVQEAPTPRQAQQIVRAAIRKVQPAPQVLILEPETPAPDEVPGAALPCTGDYEWYTPADLMARVREVLVAIDLDPASCAVAQQTVQARTFYTALDDGLRQPWPGTVFLNPPYKLPDVARFCGKLLDERAAGRTTAAILCVNNATHTDWFQSIGPRADAICFLDGKRAFTHATHDGLSPISGHAFLYFGPQVARFCEVFGVEGFLVTPLAARVSPQLPLAAAPSRARPAVTPGTVEAALLQAFHAAAPTGLRPKEAAAKVGKPGGNVSGPLQSLCYKGYLRKEGAAYVLA